MSDLLSVPQDLNHTILICDDDEDILSALEIYLRQEGYQVVKATNGLEATQAIAADQTIHLILLDIMMPVMDGIQATVKIRETSNVPIIFLSAKAEDTDQILGLNMGADDYITKPFNPIELIARVRAALRRYARLGGIAGNSHSEGMQSENDVQVSDKESIYQTGGLILNDKTKSVTIDGVDAGLTAREFSILKLLMTNIEHVLSSSQIYEAVWGEPAFDVSKTISVHIRHIREKIEINPKEPRYLKVIYGLGYKVVKLK